MALSEMDVRKLKPKDKRYVKADEKGLYIEVYTNGTKAWRFRHTSGGERTKISIGTYPEITLSEARSICEKMRRRAAHGEPLKEKKEPTFAEITEEWIETKLKPTLSKGHIDKTLVRIKRHILPEVGEMEMKEVNSAVVLGLCRKIEAAGTIETAHRVKNIKGFHTIQ